MTFTATAPVTVTPTAMRTFCTVSLTAYLHRIKLCRGRPFAQPLIGRKPEALQGGKTGVAVEHPCMTTKGTVTRIADDGSAHRQEAPLSVWERLKLAAAVPVLLAGVLMVLPLLPLVCVGEARADEELQDRGFQ